MPPVQEVEVQALIFANGTLSKKAETLDPTAFDLILAADGGSEHCRALDILPDVLIGDLDSTSAQLLETWREQGVEVIQHPQRKDKTDLEIALNYAQKQGADQITVYGALGKRLDMTLGNLLLLAHPSLSVPVQMISDQARVTVLRGEASLTLQGQKKDIVSLLPLHPDTAGITTSNLAYPLQNGTLTYGATRGISNVMESDQATITLKKGVLCVVHSRLQSEKKRGKP